MAYEIFRSSKRKLYVDDLAELMGAGCSRKRKHSTSEDESAGARSRSTSLGELGPYGGCEHQSAYASRESRSQTTEEERPSFIVRWSSSPPHPMGQAEDQWPSTNLARDNSPLSPTRHASIIDLEDTFSNNGPDPSFATVVPSAAKTQSDAEQVSRKTHSSVHKRKKQGKRRKEKSGPHQPMSLDNDKTVKTAHEGKIRLSKTADVQSSIAQAQDSDLSPLPQHEEQMTNDLTQMFMKAAHTALHDYAVTIHLERRPPMDATREFQRFFMCVAETKPRRFRCGCDNQTAQSFLLHRDGPSKIRSRSHQQRSPPDVVDD